MCSALQSHSLVSSIPFLQSGPNQDNIINYNMAEKARALFQRHTAAYAHLAGIAEEFRKLSAYATIDCQELFSFTVK